MIGKLDQRITLQANTPAADGGGGVTDSWAAFASVPEVWAEVSPARGGESLEGGAFNAQASYRFRIRHRADVTELDRILWGGVAYNIRQVARVSGRSMYLDLFAERGVAQ